MPGLNAFVQGGAKERLGSCLHRCKSVKAGNPPAGAELERKQVAASIDAGVTCGLSASTTIHAVGLAIRRSFSDGLGGRKNRTLARKATITDFGGDAFLESLGQRGWWAGVSLVKGPGTLRAFFATRAGGAAWMATGGYGRRATLWCYRAVFQMKGLLFGPAKADVERLIYSSTKGRYPAQTSAIGGDPGSCFSESYGFAVVKGGRATAWRT